MGSFKPTFTKLEWEKNIYVEADDSEGQEL